MKNETITKQELFCQSNTKENALFHQTENMITMSFLKKNGWEYVSENGPGLRVKNKEGVVMDTYFLPAKEEGFFRGERIFEINGEVKKELTIKSTSMGFSKSFPPSTIK